MMDITIKYFASIGESNGCGQESLSRPVATGG